MISLQASDKWGPSNPATRVKWLAYKAHLAEERRRVNSSNKLGFFKRKLLNLLGRQN